jgi:SAM-dependent methyltransferase
VKPAIRKVFLPASEAGADTAYWEEMWTGPPQPLMGRLAVLADRYLPGEGRLLEAGCGRGDVAADLVRPGREVVGIDLTRRALAAAHERHPKLSLAVASVGAMPFGDRSFDALVSFGVIEHLETGPVDMLREHARVLADDGLLFLTVPARNWYRRWTDRRHLGPRGRGSYVQRGRTVRLRSSVEAEQAAPGETFHQYEFPRRVLEAQLRDAGFDVIRWIPCDVAAALGDSPLVARLVGPGRSDAEAGGGEPTTSVSAGSGPSSPRAKGGVRARFRTYVRRAVIEEEGTDPLSRSIAWAISHTLGHVQLVLARPTARNGVSPPGPPRRR